MRRLALGCLLALAAALPLQLAAQQPTTLLKGDARIDVERLGTAVNMNIDTRRLSLCEARVLRSALAARQGYAFADGSLRALFLRTSWYQSRLTERWQREQLRGRDLPLSYTKEEQAFIRRLKLRETQAHGHNFIDGRPHLRNLVNPYQMEALTPQQQEMLGRQGFVVADGRQPMQRLYRQNADEWMPTFIGTDLYVLLFNRFYAQLTAEVKLNGLTEEARLLRMLLEEATQQTARQWKKSKLIRETAAKNLRWLAQQPDGAQLLAAHLEQPTDDELLQDALLAYTIGSQPGVRQAYQQLYLLGAQFDGATAQVTLTHLYEAIRRQDMPIDKLLKNKRKMQELRQTMELTRAEMAGQDGEEWGITVHSQWRQMMQRLSQRQPGAPFLMLSEGWRQHRQLVAQRSAAAAPADTLVLRMVPEGGEARPRRSATPHPPVVSGYVEPDVRFWKSALRLLTQIRQTLDNHQINSPRNRQLLRTMRQQTKFLLAVSEKELDGERLTADEHRRIGALALSLAESADTTGVPVYVLAEVDGYLSVLRGATLPVQP